MKEITSAQPNKRALRLKRSPIYKSEMVHLVGGNLHIISDEIDRWREILFVPYKEYLHSR